MFDLPHVHRLSVACNSQRNRILQSRLRLQLLAGVPYDLRFAFLHRRHLALLPAGESQIPAGSRTGRRGHGSLPQDLRDEHEQEP